MDIKVKDIAPANQTTPVKAQEKSDDSFKFTLISNIEEKAEKCNTGSAGSSSGSRSA